MVRKTISLPENMADYIEKRVQSGMFGNDSEYFRQLVREDQARQEGIAKLQAALDEARASGFSHSTHDEILSLARKKIAG